MDDAAAHPHTIPDDPERLISLDSATSANATDLVVEALKRDCVILIRNVSAEDAENLLSGVAESCGLLDRLRFQAAFAPSLGRRRVGQYAMEVNKRGAYQFIPPHSEGDSLINVQMASFYCFQNTTDGGESILMNVDDSSDAWSMLKEKTVRIAPGSRPLSLGELRRAKALYRLNVDPYLLPGDRIIGKRKSEISGVEMADVLAEARRTTSVILSRDLHAYWSSISIIDFDSLHAFASLLKECNLLRQPSGGLELHDMDSVAEQRVWHSGVNYNQIFKCKITHRLTAKELIILNNITWAHAASNWSPGVGVREVAAAFA